MYISYIIYHNIYNNTPYFLPGIVEEENGLGDILSAMKEHSSRGRQDKQKIAYK